ncbi:MAG: hypothetical protein ACRC8S_06180 [Fimbriiglobus sp.]
MSEPIQTPKPSAWRRRLRRLFWTFGLLVVLLLVLVWFAPTIIAKTSLKDQFLATATKDMDGKVRIEGLTLGWLSPVEIEGLTIEDSAGQPAATIPKVQLSRNLLQLAQDATNLGTLTVSSPVIHLRTEPGKTNWETILAKYLTPDPNKPASPKPRLTVDVQDATLHVHEGSSEQKLTGVVVKVEMTGDEPMAVKVDIPKTAIHGHLLAEIGVSDKITVKANVDDFSLSPLAPVVRRFSAGSVLEGQLTGKTEVTYAENRATVSGEVAGKNLSLGGPWLQGDTIRLLDTKIQTAKLEASAEMFRTALVEMTCDVGSMKAKGEVHFNEPVEKLLKVPDQMIHAEIDAAKLANMMPKLLHLKAGTALQEGKINVRLDSTTKPTGTHWVGTIGTTALRGTKNGQAITWEKPLKVGFDMRLDEKQRPNFDQLQCEADFIGLAGRGHQEEFILMANVDLGILSQHLADFVEMGSSKFGGFAEVSIENKMQGQTMNLAATAKIKNGHYTDSAKRSFQEPELRIALNGKAQRDPAGPVRLDTGDINIVAGADDFNAKLLEPIADIRSPKTGKVDAKLTGQLSAWQARLAPFGFIPKEWVIAGQGPVTGVVAFQETGATISKMRADMVNLKFFGAGLDVNEEKCKLEANGTWQSATNAVKLTDVVIHCDTIAWNESTVDVQPNGQIDIVGNFTANLNRVQKILKLAKAADNSDAINGSAIGRAKVSLVGSAVDFSTDLVTINNFMYGNPGKPTWKEPWLKLQAQGKYDNDTLSLAGFRAERDGMTASGSGGLSKISSTMDLDINGKLAYDLAKLEPQLRELLGPKTKVVGQGERNFAAAGPLGSPQGALVALKADGGVNWQQVQAYGFDVGPSELVAKLENGVLRATPISASFGGGTVKVQPTVTMNTPTMDLTLAPGKIVEKAQLNPEVLSNALGYAVPSLAGSTQASGLVSLDLQENRIPVSAPTTGTLKGKITMHNYTVTPGPLVTQVLEAIGAKQTSLKNEKEQIINVKMENGRVHHDNFVLTIGKAEIRSRGSVGLDGSLSLMFDAPIPERLLSKVKLPAVRELLSNQRVSIPVGGTLNKPALDARRIDANFDELLSNAMKNGGGKLGEKLLDGLLKKK